MKTISNQYGKYMEYCKENNLMPTDEGFKIYMESKKIVICSK